MNEKLTEYEQVLILGEIESRILGYKNALEAVDPTLNNDDERARAELQKMIETLEEIERKLKVEWWGYTA